MSFNSSLTTIVFVQKPQSVTPNADKEGAIVLEKQIQKTQPPPLYKVIMLNDEFTPMDFVVELLQILFTKTHEQAVQIMLQIHVEGQAICGVYTCDVAQTKVDMAHRAAAKDCHPLKCLSEPVNE